ncbi:MAG: BspA family leucine-rich repeat surface protein [Bacteroidales bacterium]|nr:BspA family leucine-rich repeat surface protein [Bacteroidales bacterium]
MANLNIKHLQCKVGIVFCKIKFTIALIFTLIAMLSAQKAAAQDNREAYAVFDDGTLTFKYDDQKPIGAYGMKIGDDDEWSDVAEQITKVVFDKSFADYRPTSCYCWFSGCSNLKEIVDMDKYLNTENVTDMGGMFHGCSSLISLDVSNFNTNNVMNMNSMFSNCSGPPFLDVSNFNTEKVTGMSWMFYGCSSLTSLDVSNFNTGNVGNMPYMFSGCSNLTTLDLSNFKTNNVSWFKWMFYDCNSLTTIVVSDQWNTANLDPFDGGSAFFSNSPFLIGNAGTTYSYDHQDVDYAHIDLGESKPGYLTTESYKVFYDLDGDGKIDDINTVDWENDATPPTSFDLKDTPELPIPNPISKKGLKFKGWKGTPITGLTEDNLQKDISIPAGAVGNRIYTALWKDKEAYVVVSTDSTTLTFYYDDQKSNRTGAGVHGIDETDQGGFPKWINIRYYDTYIDPCIENPYTTVVFDASFKDAKPTSCAWWFNYCTKLIEIKGIENLNTDDVTDMGSMFSGCSSLTTIDVSKFNTANVTNMDDMFSGCSSLTTLDVSHLNTANVMDMFGMFWGCSSLTTLDVSKFNTANVTNMGVMFQGCSSLTTLDVSNFNTANVTNMDAMFDGCSSLITLDVSKFNTSSVTNMEWMFYNCSSLTTLDVSSFDTKNVTDMGYMFSACSSLTTLDVSSFDTKNVTDMRDMFDDCYNLSTIIVSNQWKTTNVKSSAEEFGEDWYAGPFRNIPNLIGNAGTTYSDGHTDVDYAHIDGEEGKPGYLTTDSYKVFYDLDGGEWGSDANPPTEFALNLTENIKIPIPKKKGMTFLGWTGTLASGISSETPVKNVEITPDKLGNRIYTAHWEAKSNYFAIPQTITYPEVANDNDDVCNGNVRYTVLRFSLPEDVERARYQLSVDGITSTEGDLPNNGDCEIRIDIPDGKTPGRYPGNIKLYFDRSNTPNEYPITIEVAVAQNVILHLHKNVIFVNNHDGRYQDNGYQWYHNDQEDKGEYANRQFFYEPKLSGKYKARMLTTDGVTVYSCPIDEGDDIAKSQKQPVKTYPNPAVEGAEFVIEILDYNPETDYTIIISNNNSVIVNEIHDAEQISPLSMPRGVYSGALISGGKKRGFKLMVK